MSGEALRVVEGGRTPRGWEALWDSVDARLGPYLAINVAVAFRKLA